MKAAMPRASDAHASIPPAAADSASSASSASPTHAHARELKHELKRWEAEFHHTHGRAPTKDDLARLPDIAGKYRAYSKLKRAANGINNSSSTPATGDRRMSFDSRVMLPLETSILTMSLKRKAVAPRASISSATAPLLSTPTPTLIGNDSEDTMAATPKRPRANTPPKTASKVSLEVERDDLPVAADMDVGMASYAECEAVVYTPPPSLIQRYNQRLSSTSTPMPDKTALAADAAHLSSADTAGNAARTIEFTTQAQGLKARAGKLVKTTSIPLSVFGANFRGASQLLSSQGYLSDGNDDTQTKPLLPGAMADLDSGELVFCKEPAGEEPTGLGADAKPVKKATQKRSTRRVKLKPVGKDGSVEEPTRSKRARSQQLVSENFYKLKLKSGRRGPRSSEDRRSALYKRMIAKKQRPGGGKPSTTTQSSREPHVDGMWGNEGGYEDGSDDEPGDTGLSSPTQSAAAASPAVEHRQAILGQPLSYFYADETCDADGSSLAKLRANSADAGATLDLRKILQHVWKFDTFRPGQAAAIRRIVESRSTLLSLATGAGKSLAYQLPALVLWAAHGSLTLVVTPLLSLMRDQIQQLPEGVQAVCLSSESTGKDAHSDATARLMAGKVQLLFVSPERLQSRRFQNMMAADGMPRVQLAVVDEAHCADEWSHSFRPAYLQLPQLLQQLGAPCVLAMTGTATSALTARLCNMFGIAADGVVRGSAVRSNIELSVVAVDMGAHARVRTTAREDALVSLLRTPAMARLGSIIVYVATQASADRVAEYLTVRSIPAQAYHAGKPAAERTRIQNAFMHMTTSGSASVRVLVATVAFGMGLNKRDVRAVVHFNLPRSMEAYVQEIGRAGRDGAPARGVLLLATRPCDSVPGAPACTSADAELIRSWAHAVGIDMSAVRRLLRRLLPADFIRRAITAALRAQAQRTPHRSSAWKIAHTAVVELKDLETDADVDQATAQTLVGYLALVEPDMIRLQPNTNRRCRVRFTRTDLGKLAESHQLFAHIASLVGEAGVVTFSQRRGGIGTRFPGAKRHSTEVEVDIFDLANRLGADPADVVSELYQWRGRREVMLEWQAPSCVVDVTLDTSRFVDLESAAGDSEAWGESLARRIDEHISTLAATVAQQNEARVRDSLGRVDAIEAAMLAAHKLFCQAHEHCPDGSDALEVARGLQNLLLQTAIEVYFATTQDERDQAASRLKEQANAVCAGAVGDTLLAGLLSPPKTAAGGNTEAAKDVIRTQVCEFVQQHSGELRSARAIARVFHGLSGPSTLPSQWMWCSEWGSLVATDFAVVQQCAQEELVRLRCAAAAATNSSSDESAKV